MADNDLLGVIPDDDISYEEDIPTKTYKIDWENGRIGGNADDIDAIQQAIAKALLTPRFKCFIYDDDYGSEIQDEMTDSSPDYVMAILPELIKDALLVDNRIIEVGDFDVSQENDGVSVSFTAHTIYGDIQVSEVI